MYYIIKTPVNFYAFYHTRDRGVVRRVYQRGRWSAEQIIADGARENFTVSLEGEKLYLFCQDRQGDIILTTFLIYDDTSKSRVVLKNQSDKIHPIIFHPIVMESGLAILYNMTSAEERSGFIALRRLDSAGQWAPAARIDQFIPFGVAQYEVQRVSSEHLLLFYQTRTSENNMGYREITPDRQGKYQIFYTTNYFVSDAAYLTTEDSIHTLLVIKSMFSSQLVYRKKEGDAFGNPVVLHEAQRIEKCLLLYVKGSLQAFFLAAGQLFVCASEDKGGSFSRPVRYKNKFCQNPEKAYFVSQTPQSESQLFARQVYVDHASPWDVQVLPDLYEDFYPAPEQAQPGGGQPEINMETQEELERLRNQISLLEKHSAEKDRQILQLTHALQRKNSE
ncbi:MAG: hypothetical protein LBT44_09240 [Clostridiales bacterium]|nr:hypothetical protein [Clostridiales bacterium]